MLYRFISNASVDFNLCVVVTFQSTCRYIAKTLYGEDDDEISPDQQKNVEEPKLLGLHPGSNEKVHLMIIYVDCLLISVVPLANFGFFLHYYLFFCLLRRFC